MLEYNLDELVYTKTLEVSAYTCIKILGFLYYKKETGFFFCINTQTSDAYTRTYSRKN